MSSGRLWMGSYWEPTPTPCARRWGEVRHACQARQVRQGPLGPKRARHVWCARCVRAPRAPSVPHAPAAPGAPRSGHAQSVPGAPAHVTAHIGKHVGPSPPSLSKTSAQSRRGAHHGVWWACTQQAICQHPRRPCQKPLESDRVVAAYDPDSAAKCMLYCFLTGMVALRAAGNMLAPPPSLSKNNTKCSRGSRA
jgi:hypothetical protein